MNRSGENVSYRYRVIFVEEGKVIAVLNDSRDDKMITIDTSYSVENMHNYSYKDMPIGTIFTYKGGFINSFWDK